MQDVYIVGGHISNNTTDKGNVFSVPSNEYAEFNMFLDPLATKTVFESSLNITLIPLSVQRSVGSFSNMLTTLRKTNMTPEALLARQLLSRLWNLKKKHRRYNHMVKSLVIKMNNNLIKTCFFNTKLSSWLQDIFLGEILGTVYLAGNASQLNPNLQIKPIKVYAEGVESKDGQILIHEKQGKYVRILDSINSEGYYNMFANQLSAKTQSAVVSSFDGQKRMWHKPPPYSN